MLSKEQIQRQSDFAQGHTAEREELVLNSSLSDTGSRPPVLMLCPLHFVCQHSTQTTVGFKKGDRGEEVYHKTTRWSSCSQG